MRFSLRARPRRRWALDLLVIVVGIVVGVVLVATVTRDSDPPPLAAPIDPLLPDLVMAPIEDVIPGLRSEDGRQPLQFSATIANIGAGDFLAEATRSWPWTDDWSVNQRIQDGAGGYSEQHTEAGLVFGGDGHDHWHIKAVEAHTLERIDTGEVLAEVVKIGFCFYDTNRLDVELPRSPDEATYFSSACESQITTGQVVGLSVGWGDLYPAALPEQRFYIEDVPAGRYRIRQVADPNDDFEELDETNNETWVDIELEWFGQIPSATIIDRAPEP